MIEIKKEESIGTTLDTILYQGTLHKGDKIALNASSVLPPFTTIIDVPEITSSLSVIRILIPAADLMLSHSSNNGRNMWMPLMKKFTK